MYKVKKWSRTEFVWSWTSIALVWVFEEFRLYELFIVVETLVSSIDLFLFCLLKEVSSNWGTGSNLIVAEVFGDSEH